MKPSQALESSLDLEPTQPERLVAQGSVLFDLERFSEALESFERTIALDPETILHGTGRVKHILNSVNQKKLSPVLKRSCQRPVMCVRMAAERELTALAQPV